MMNRGISVVFISGPLQKILWAIQKANLNSEALLKLLRQFGC